MQKTVAGILVIPGDEDVYWLLHPYPIEKGDSWMRDDMTMFYVATTNSIARHIVVRGPFVIDYGQAGRKVTIKESVEVEMNMEDEHPETIVDLDKLIPAEMSAEN